MLLKQIGLNTVFPVYVYFHVLKEYVIKIISDLA